MVTTLHEPPQAGQDPPRPGSGAGGGWRSLVPTDGILRATSDHSPEPSRTGIWVGLAAIAMSFAAFTSALLVRQGTTDWQHFALPRILYLNTVLLIASSITLEVARRRVASFMGGRATKIALPLAWLYATLALGLLFVAGQYEAWLQLRSRGLYLPTNPSSSFFYVFTSVHVLHVLGGLGGLMAVISKLKRLVLRRSTLDATSHYWHFMDILWLYLLLILWTKF
jgi:cytochrome c oxidase subunit 3